MSSGKGDEVLPQPAVLTEGTRFEGEQQPTMSGRRAKGSCVKPHQFAAAMSAMTPVLELHGKQQRFLVFCVTYTFYSDLPLRSHGQAHQRFPDHYLISVSLLQRNSLFNYQSFLYWVWLPAAVVTEEDLSLLRCAARCCQAGGQHLPAGCAAAPCPAGSPQACWGRRCRALCGFLRSSYRVL